MNRAVIVVVLMLIAAAIFGGYQFSTIEDLVPDKCVVVVEGGSCEDIQGCSILSLEDRDVLCIDRPYNINDDQVLLVDKTSQGGERSEDSGFGTT